MSGRRFELVTKFLHLNDSENRPSRDSSSYDRLYKIRPFLDVLLTNFKKNYKPSHNLSINESMISFKGRLADARNGYVYNWKLYTGKDTSSTSGKGLGHPVVLELVQDLVGNEHTIYVDNFYTSPSLFTDLIQLGFKACGTLNPNRRGITHSFQLKSSQKDRSTQSE